MVELQPGTLLEERRGGSAILSTLINEMIENSTNGYIRCERTPKEEMPRVGQLVIFNREIVAAFFEAKRPQFGAKAIKNIEADSQALDCILQVITGVDIPRLLEIYPEAKISNSNTDSDQDTKWWQTLSNRENTWTRSRRSLATSQEYQEPEFMKIKGKLSDGNSEITEFLRPGSVYSTSSNEIFKLAANLSNLGRPLLVISRLSSKNMLDANGVPEDAYLLISRQEGERNISPDIDGINDIVASFLEGNIRAVMVFDGLEYLSSTNDSDKVINLVRDLADNMRYEDDCMFICVNEENWSKQEYIQLIRAAPVIDSELLQNWNSDPAQLEDHPLLAPLTEEEISQMEAYISMNTPIDSDEIEIESHIEIEEVLEEELSTEEILESIEVEDIIIEEIQQEEKKYIGPRSAQIVKRRKAKHSEPIEKIINQNASIIAARGKTIDSKFPETNNLPKTPIGKGRVGELPEIPNIIPTSLNQVVKQKSSTRDLDLPTLNSDSKTINLTKKDVSGQNVLSPVAARGIEVKKNLTNRSQASSRPQRKIDLDKRLKSWVSEDVE